MDHSDDSIPSRKPSLRRVSVSDTHLPKLDTSQRQNFAYNKEKGPFARVLSGLLEGTSELSLNKFGSSTNSLDANFHKDLSERPFHQSELNSSPPSASQNVELTSAASTTTLTPTLNKSYSTGFSLFGGHYNQQHQLHQQQSNPTLSPFQHKAPSISAITSEHQQQQYADQGLIMNLSASQPRSAALSTPGIVSSIANNTPMTTVPVPDKKSLFAGLFSLDHYINKPVPVIADKEENYRLIMALER